MNNFVKYFTLALGLLLFLVAAPDAQAQKSKKKKKPKKEVKGHDGMVKGEVPAANAERQYLLDRQQAMTQAKQNGYSTGSAYSVPGNQYDAGGGRYAKADYINKNAAKKKKKKPKKRIIDEDNPDGKMYKESQKRKKRKILFFYI